MLRGLPSENSPEVLGRSRMESSSTCLQAALGGSEICGALEEVQEQSLYSSLKVRSREPWEANVLSAAFGS